MDKNYPIEERNLLIVEFFNYHGFTDIALIGDENQPKIILDDMKAVSGFVKNKIYNFTNKQFGGEVIYRVNLNEKEAEDSTFIKNIIYSAERKKVYRLKLSGQKMFYIRTEKYIPYFSNVESRFFFNVDKARSIQQFLLEKHEIETELV